MHIPDGYLGPKTCLALYTVMAGVWYLAFRKTKERLHTEQLPLCAFAAAFMFVVMMFNFPLPGGTTAHITGVTIVAIVLGPWAAIVAVSVTLLLQALLFGDGGITTFGANAFNMAFLMSVAGFYVYSAIERGDGKRVFVASFVAAYVGVVLSALATAVELGIQPALEVKDGRPLYAPYSLGITLPALMVPHLFFVAPIEALATALVVTYLARTEPAIFTASVRPSAARLWIILVLLSLLSPVGLLASGSAWGEWGREEVLEILGYIPEGMDYLGGIWRGIFSDYEVEGLGSAAGYVVSALVGSFLAVMSVYIIGRVWKR